MFCIEFDGFERTVRLEAPVASVEKAMREEILKVQGNVRIDGFRKGKVPVEVIERKFGKEVRNRHAYKIFDEIYQSVLKDYEIHPIAKPRVISSHMDGDLVSHCLLQVGVLPMVSFVLEDAVVGYSRIEGNAGDFFVFQWMRFAFGREEPTGKPIKRGDTVRFRVSLYEGSSPLAWKQLAAEQERKLAVSDDNIKEFRYLEGMLGHKLHDRFNVCFKDNGGDSCAKVEVLAVTSSRFEMSEILDFEKFFGESEKPNLRGLIQLAKSHLDGFAALLNCRSLSYGVWELLVEGNGLDKLPSQLLMEEVDARFKDWMSVFSDDSQRTPTKMMAAYSEIFAQSKSVVTRRLVYGQFVQQHEKYVINGSFFADALKRHIGKIDGDTDAMQYYNDNEMIKDAFYDYALGSLLSEEILRYTEEDVDCRSMDSFVAAYTGL